MTNPIQKKLPKLFTNIWVAITLVFVSLTLAVIAGETVLRIGKTNFGKRIDKKWFDQFVSYNTHGYRDREHTYKKDREKFRILILGDSMTVGSGIEKMENTYPKKLETYLNMGLEQPKFEVINMAHPGWNTDSQAEDLYLNGFNFQPDMVLLAYYHNDIPRPDFIKCKRTKVEIFFSDSRLDRILKNSLLYLFIKHRLINLEEKFTGNPNFINCIKSTYDSLGWEMEKVYLDWIFKACKTRNVKFLIGVIPLMYKLEENYPLQFVHAKMKQYCNERGIDCVDFYNETFRGKNERDLIFSDQDNHLNHRGAELIAQALYKNLAPLREFDRLPLFHRVFTLNELLTKNQIALSLDQSYDQIADKSRPLMFSKKITSNNKKYSLKAWKSKGNYQFEKTEFASNSGNKRSVTTSTLDRKGGFLRVTFESYDPQTQEVNFKDHMEYKENLYFYTLAMVSQDKQRAANFVYKFNGLKNDLGVHLFLENQYPAESPKALLSSLLSVSEAEESAKLEEEIFNQFLFFYRYNWVTFIESLFDEVLQIKTAPIVVRAISRIYLRTGNKEKYNELAGRFPELISPSALY
ncbi:MAG: SGNH/GDSL hydrolase family protein [Nitrospinae bacterium]|nr:SGNH/GDSL hydrolase family protein [Nitrospinota bacterium]